MNISSIQSFDLVRVTKAKKEVDICSNTIRAFAREPNGLRLYRKGRATFFSRSELNEFIRKTSAIAA